MYKYFPLKKWDRFWKLTALWKYEHKPIWTQWVKQYCEWCICDCWKEALVARTYLNTWHTRSCWCARWEPKTKHWDAKSRLYKIYITAKGRCNNPKSHKYERYWKRWIKFLRNTYEEFKKDMWLWYNEHIKEYWEKNTQLDRIDNDWHYCKENCRRVTAKENSRNRRSNHLVDFKWEMISLIEAYEIWEPTVSLPVFLSRVYQKWLGENIELALHGTNEEIKKYLSSKK